ncbi:helix-turn-helix domain-containing protein [Halobacillus trueperi]|uniref:helix-turn-helix domain-containing protein n=1 Tax=Halobacillus trueperi TaxID=156205 RepID=UPI0037353363
MIGKNIVEIRKRKNLSLSELAERACISKSYLSNIEREINQNPSILMLRKISIALNVNLEEVLDSGDYSRSSSFPIEKEWIEFVHDLQSSGMKKEQIHEYKTIMEFIRWQNVQKTDKEWKEGNLNDRTYTHPPSGGRDEPCGN